MKFCFTNRITNLTELTAYVNAYLMLLDNELLSESESAVKWFICVSEAKTYDAKNIAHVLLHGTAPLEVDNWIVNLYEEVDDMDQYELDEWLQIHNGTVNNSLNVLLSEYYNTGDIDLNSKLSSQYAIQLVEEQS